MLAENIMHWDENNQPGRTLSGLPIVADGRKHPSGRMNVAIVDITLVSTACHHLTRTLKEQQEENTTSDIYYPAHTVARRAMGLCCGLSGEEGVLRRFGELKEFAGLLEIGLFEFGPDESAAIFHGHESLASDAHKGGENDLIRVAPKHAKTFNHIQLKRADVLFV